MQFKQKLAYITLGITLGYLLMGGIVLLTNVRMQASKHVVGSQGISIHDRNGEVEVCVMDADGNKERSLILTKPDWFDPTMSKKYREWLMENIKDFLKDSEAD